MAQSEIQGDRRPVNPHATVHVGKSHAGEPYNIYNVQGELIKSGKVAPQGTLYVGTNHAGSEVIIQKADSISEEQE